MKALALSVYTRLVRYIELLYERGQKGIERSEAASSWLFEVLISARGIPFRASASQKSFMCRLNENLPGLSLQSNLDCFMTVAGSEAQLESSMSQCSFFGSLVNLVLEDTATSSYWNIRGR